MKAPVTITVKGPTYYSNSDEEQFFAWLGSIPSVRAIGGVGAKVSITLTSRRISQRDLREIVAIFLRYKLDMRPLALLDTSKVAWFRSPNAYWFKKVFGAVASAKKPTR